MRGSFLTFVAIRVGFWLATAATLLWAPLAVQKAAPDRAWGPLGDVFFGAFDQWDARWFLQIARHGYDATSAAFFPLYPALLHLLGSSVVWGSLLSLAAAGVGAMVLAEIARPVLGTGGARDAVLVLALFPTAFVFTAVYSDGLFLALSAGSFLAAQRGRPWLAGIAGALAVATRLVGIALLPALVLLLWPRLRRLAPLVLLPAAIGAFALYLDRKLGDAWAFGHAQGHWERETATLGPIDGLWDAVQAGGHGARIVLTELPRGQGFTQPEQIAFWNATHLVLLFAAAWLTWIAWRRLGPAFGLYSLATLLLVLAVPSKGFPLVSLPRFLMDDFPIVLAIAAVIRQRPQLRTGVLVTLGVLSGLAGVAFARGIWIA